MLVPARNFVLLWLLSRETGLWLPGMRNQTLSENTLWEYAREIGHRPSRGLREADFALTTHDEHYLLLLNQEAMSVN